MTRQYLHQQKWKAKGLCITCGQPRDPASPIHCTTHLESARAAKRNAYRKSRGIPLDAPLNPAGRKRKGQKAEGMKAILDTLADDDIRREIVRRCIDNKWTTEQLAAAARMHYSTVRRFLLDPDTTTFYSARAIAEAVGLKMVASGNNQTP